MRFIDDLALHPVCFNAATDQFDFDASDYIEGATSFDIGEVADQLIDQILPVDINGVSCFKTVLTAKYHELVKRPIHTNSDTEYQALDMKQLIGIIPPFDSCFFEYATHKYFASGSSGTTERNCGIHLASMPIEYIQKKIPDYQERGITFALSATVFFRHFINGQYRATRETVAYITADADGRVVTFRIEALLPDNVDRSLPQNVPQLQPIVVLLVALMMLNCKMLKSTLVEPPPKSRQQRRFEEGHPNRATPPLVRHYTLKIDLDKTGTGTSGAGKKGGWEQAWHQVRGFLRRTKSGKVVVVRPHARGNPLKGVIFKDYKLKGKEGNAA